MTEDEVLKSAEAGNRSVDALAAERDRVLLGLLKLRAGA
jgi:hypothetical protein